LENLTDGEDINRARENITENIKPKESVGLHELKQHKPQFDEECLGFLDQKNQATMRWLPDPNQSSVDNLHNIRLEGSRHFRNKKKEYLKAKIEELRTNSKIKNIMDLHRGVSDFRKGNQPRTNKVKDEKDDLVADSYGILARWRNHFSQLLNILGVNDVRQRAKYLGV